MLHAGDRVRIRDERWQVTTVATHGVVAVVDVNGCDTANRGHRARFLLPFEPVDRLPRSPAPRLVGPARWRHVARRALADASEWAATLHAAPRASIDILPFQLEPALAFARGDACRILIADAVGMGKTIQAALIVGDLVARDADSRVLIVTPAGLREQWRDELRARFGLDVVAFDAAGIARAQAGLPIDVNPWAVHRLVITSIDFVKRPEVIRSHETMLWDLIVFDEAHGLGGRSDRAAAADALGRRARRLVLLTATPHSGDDDAFRRMCRIGQVETDGPLLVFRRTRDDIGMAAARRSVMLPVTPTPAERAMHAALGEYARLVWKEEHAAGARLAMTVLMRRASSSASSLARSLDRRLVLLQSVQRAGMQPSLPFDVVEDDAEPDAVLGAPGLADADEERQRLERLRMLAAAASANESKLTALRRLLRRAGEPAIVFTEYRDTLEHVAAALADWPVAKLHGALNTRERTDVLRRFAGGSAVVLLATDAASEGLNLHHRCRLVINLELPWTPLRLEQRIGRVDRIGQQKRVHAVQLLAAGTSEQHVLAKLTERKSRIDAAECVLGGRGVPEGTADPLPAFEETRRADLTGCANAEAERIVRARTLIAAAGNSVGDNRPVVTHLRHKQGAQYWLFRVIVTTGDGRLLRVIPLPLAGVAAVDLQRAAATACAEARTRLDVERVAIMHTFRVQLDRERGLLDDLVNQQARLSAALLQPGLFDRRFDRAAAAQASLLEQALAASAARTAILTAAESLHVDACDLVFAVALD